MFSKCLSCDRTARIRGLCGACRERQRRAVAAGVTTEADLIAAGQLLPASEKRWCKPFVVNPRKGCG